MSAAERRARRIVLASIFGGAVAGMAVATYLGAVVHPILGTITGTAVALTGMITIPFLIDLRNRPPKEPS